MGFSGEARGDTAEGGVANDAGRERKLHELRALLDESDADAKAGRFADFDSDAAFLADLRKRGGARGQSPKKRQRA